ncbi:alpha/beta fold hydrolase [Desnuesiella massiliensis]|uniref:alpha/beta fold hydrolase n=1 Tax=Desnuesiella massiliensis TaxID=1650662 RepID=UPI0006E35B2D|nr:alpha/beta hydrolase [Desnuesiella massiliensis]
MNKKYNKFKIACIGLIGIILLWAIHPTWTPKINGLNSISEYKTIKINGSKQQILIRGKDRKNPVIIFIHGGPGCPETPYARKYQSLLEENFTVINYDQRGMGKSFSFFQSYPELSIDTLVTDLIEITDYVPNELKVEKVILAGHSFGTIIGVKAAALAPERYYAYIGIGQVGDFWKGELEALEYCLSQAKLKGNDKDINKIEDYRSIVESKEESFPREYVRKYGGAARLINEGMDMLKGVLFNAEYNFLDGIKYIKGLSMADKKLWNEVKNTQLTKEVKTLDIPCYFISGRYDYLTSIGTAKSYLESIAAPVKDFIVFEKSAHFPQYEEKEEFSSWLKEICSKLEIK